MSPCEQELGSAHTAAPGLGQSPAFCLGSAGHSLLSVTTAEDKATLL